MAEVFDLNVSDGGLQRRLDLLSSRMRNMRPVFSEVGELLKTSIAKNFEVEGRYSEAGSWRGGTRKWAPLSVETLFSGRGKKKFFKKSGDLSSKGKRQLQGKRKLIDSGAMLGSITYVAGRGSLTIGSNLAYAAIQNFGGKAGRGGSVTITARPFFVIQDEDLEQVNDILDEYLLGQL